MGTNCVKDKQEDEVNTVPTSKSLREKESDLEDEFYYFSKLDSSNTSQLVVNQSDSRVTIEDFSLLKVLGKGSFGKVMLAEHRKKKKRWPLMFKGKLYAMKVTLISSAELLLAIELMHTNKILDRDLKTENILLDEEGHLKIIGFGLSKMYFIPYSQFRLVSGERAYSLCGTPEYLAPEVITQS
jgi:serine/threonine protein kinase